jgi:hypothetical protein
MKVCKFNKISLYVLTIIASLYIATDTMSIRVNPIQLALFVLFFCVVFLFFFIKINSLGFAGEKKGIYLLTFLFIYILFIPIYVLVNEWYLKYFSADIISFLLLFIFIFYATSSTFFMQNIAYIKFLLVMLIIAFILGFLMCSDCQSRYEPPHFLVFSSLYALLYYNEKRSHFFSIVFYSIVYCLVMIAVYFSQERTTFILGLLIIFIYLYYKNRYIMYILFLSLIVLFISLDYSLFAFGRFETLFSDKGDQSILSRFNEVLDVIEYFKHYADFFHILFGFGFSATYEPINFTSDPGNLTDSGTVHHVHIFPFLLLFRFGLIGLLLYLLLWFSVISQMFNMSKKYKYQYNTIYVFSLLSMFMYLLDSLMRSVFVDPFFYIIIGFYLYFLFHKNKKFSKEINFA